MFSENLFVTKEEVVSIEVETAHKNHCLKTNLAKKIFTKFVQDALKHGHWYEPVDMRKYYEIMQYEMKRDIFLERPDFLYNPCCSGYV